MVAGASDVAGDAVKNAVRESYDSEAERYAGRTRLQAKNLTKLLSYIGETCGSLRVARALDVGCGTGIAAKALSSSSVAVADYLGIDLSPAMITIARREFAGPGVHFEAGDAEHLPVRSSEFDLVLSNSVLHWLNQPQLGHDPSLAVAEMDRVLKPGGRVALSVAGVGTGSRFRRSYLTVMEREAKRPDFDGRLFLRNPIGLMQLHEVLNLLLGAGFDVLRGQLDFEPQVYPAAADYAGDVRAYGFSIFLAAIPVERREGGWDGSVSDFIAQFGAAPYRHDQYMIYVIAQKRS